MGGSGLESTLLHYLRSSGLTGCKLSCGEGSCGSCTVLLSRWVGRLEEITVTACSLPLASLHGQHVTTVEGVGSARSGLHPVQQRLHQGHGSQCGFCSPGMVMSMLGVLKQCPTPDIEDIFSGLQGNLCRCTGYRPIIEAFSSFTSETGQGQEDQSPSIAPEILQSMRGLSQEKFGLESSGSMWIKPVKMEEIFELMKQYPEHRLRQGGTGSYKKFTKVNAKVIIDISGVMELKTVTKSREFLHIGAGVTFTNLLRSLSDLLSSCPNITHQELSRVVGCLATPQVRNVASLAGTILWSHPASDLVPLLVVAGARLVLGTSPSITREISLEEFLGGSGLERGELLISVKLPLSEERRVKTYKHARRKTADLAIANMAVGWTSRADGKLADLQIVVGGVGVAVKECQMGVATRAKHLESLLSQTLDGISPDAICLAVEKDLLTTEKSSDLEKMAFRVSLVTGFVMKFLRSVTTSSPAETESSVRAFKSHNLYEKTPADQPALDPVTRPVPVLSSAEQCSGEAEYVDDLPVYDRELRLFPVHSSSPHARLVSVNVESALAVPGVLAWISHLDVPGRSLWSVGPVPDEEIFPSETVQYVGQIIGLIAAESEAAGLAGVEAVTVEYDELPAILTLAEAEQRKSIFGEKFSARKDVREKNNVTASLSSGKTVSGVVRLGGQEVSSR